MKENYHIVWWNEMKTLLLQKKQLYNVTVPQKNKIRVYMHLSFIIIFTLQRIVKREVAYEFQLKV